MIFQNKKTELISNFLMLLQSILLFLFCLQPLQLHAQDPDRSNLVRNQLPSGIEQSIEFDRDILPIFRERCFSCHSAEKVEGDLRLDDEILARKGGHTGQSIFGASSESSELYNRILSTESGYKMPKKGASLTKAQIQLIKSWLDQGSRWGTKDGDLLSEVDEDSKPEVAPDSPQQKPFVDRALEFVLGINEHLSHPHFRHFGIVYWSISGLALLFVLKLLVCRFRSKSTKGDIGTGLLGFLTWRLILVLSVIVAGLGIIQFQKGEIDELNKEVAKVKLAARKQPSIVVTNNRKKLAMPAFPQHPPRLGGEYYRGNDERDPDLFNGGFYRTATLRLSLVDAQGKRLAWGSPISSDPLAIELLIERAPGTTMKLFEDRIFAETHVRRFRETELLGESSRDESEPLQFENVIPEKQWRVIIPLEKTEVWQGNQNAGVAYVFYGSQIENGMQGRAHYGIRFDIREVEGRISDQSQIWMGSIYDLGGRVLVPQPGEILLDHWFDFRPIPEIEGSNTIDRTLLGIPEHEDQ